MNGGPGPHEPYQLVKECNENFLMHIFALTDLVFLLRSAQSGKKYTSGQFQKHKSERKHGN